MFLVSKQRNTSCTITTVSKDLETLKTCGEGSHQVENIWYMCEKSARATRPSVTINDRHNTELRGVILGYTS